MSGETLKPAKIFRLGARLTSTGFVACATLQLEPNWMERHARTHAQMQTMLRSMRNALRQHAQ
eukprot:264626-Lingulodinium_polyedra.AAC.1